MKLYYPTKAEAQAKADALHEWMIANDPAYAASVKAGHTKRWAIPAQDKDDAGKPLNTKWYVVCKDRCDGALSVQDRVALK